jgi:hypothetical protein
MDLARLPRMPGPPEHGRRSCIIGQQLRLTVLADVPIEGGPASAVRGVAAAVEAEAAALLDRQGVAGAVDRRAAQVLGEPGSSAEADGDAVALERYS